MGPSEHFYPAGMTPLEMVCAYVRQAAKGRTVRPDTVYVVDGDDPLVREAHFGLWLQEKFAVLGQEKPTDIVPSLLEKLYGPEFEAHAAEHHLKFDSWGELLSW